MRIVVHGQQAFGKAVLEALLKRGENVVGVYVAPEKEGAKADPLKEAALAAKLPVCQPASYKDSKVWEEFKALKPDLQVMAFVTLFVPEEFLNIPTQGSIQFARYGFKIAEIPSDEPRRLGGVRSRRPRCSSAARCASSASSASSCTAASA